MNRRARGVYGLIAVILLGLLLPGSKVQALSSSTSYIMLYIDKTEAYINNQKNFARCSGCHFERQHLRARQVSGRYFRD